MAFNRAKRARQHQRQRMLTHKRRFAKRATRAKARKPNLARKAVSSSTRVAIARTGRSIDKFGVSRVLLPRMTSMPNMCAIKLNHTHLASVDVGLAVGGVADVIHMRNSMFLPRSGGSHQCKEWDFWTAIYTSYNISKIVFTVKCIPEGVASPIFYFGHLFWDNEGAEDFTIGVANVILEAKRYKKRFVSFPDGNGRGSAALTMRQTVYPGKLINEIDPTLFWTPVTANPNATQLTTHKLRFANTSAYVGSTEKMNVICSVDYFCTLRGKVAPSLD